MGAEKVGLKSRTNPASMCCLSALLSIVVKCFVTASIDMYCVMSKSFIAIFIEPMYPSHSALLKLRKECGGLLRIGDRS